MITAERAYAMLGNAELWNTAKQCHDVLDSVGVPHAICGGVAVCLHGYQRNTVDLDLIVRSNDSSQIKQVLQEAGLSWNAREKEFRTADGVSVQFLVAGDRAGKDQEVKLPDPVDERTIEIIESLPVLRLARLIEIKLACGTGDLRRTYKDYADVVELIAIHGLDGSYARHLHKSVRKTFRELVRNARG